MTSILEHYRVLGVNMGAGIADVTSSYKRLCRKYHPDVNDDPGSEELMKRINIAYAVLREKLIREAAFRERTPYSRPVRRYAGTETRANNATTRKAGAESEREAFSVLERYFKSICACDYTGAYACLSSYDKRSISRASFIEWRKSVARLYPIRAFKITGGLQVATVSFNDGRTFSARRYRIAVTEGSTSDESTQSGTVEKLVINENGLWRVFLGYRGVSELTRTFEERYEAKRKRDVTKRWEEYYAGICPEYDMLSLMGMRKAVSHEIYRQKRFGGMLTFAAISVKAGGSQEAGQEELLRSAAGTICGTLRETDIPAYAGDGVFAILFVELRKKNVEEIVSRLIEKIRKNAGAQLGGRAVIEYAYESWPGHGGADEDSVNKVLKKFRKKV